MSDLPVSSGKHSGIQVIARAGAIMRTLANHPQGLSLRAVALEVGLPRSTVQRIINALCAEHLVEVLGPAGGFCLGPALGQLINQAQVDIISLVRPHLAALSETVQESTCLLALSGEKIHVLDRIVAERPLRVVFPIGIHFAAIDTPGGKLLLSALSEGALRPLLSGFAVGDTQGSCRVEALLGQLEELKHVGVADDRDEALDGLCSDAILLDTYLGHYSISIVAPITRALAQKNAFLCALRTCKQNIEASIGRASGVDLPMA